MGGQHEKIKRLQTIIDTIGKHPEGLTIKKLETKLIMLGCTDAKFESYIIELRDAELILEERVYQAYDTKEYYPDPKGVKNQWGRIPDISRVVHYEAGKGHPNDALQHSYLIYKPYSDLAAQADVLKTSIPPAA